MQEKTQKEKEGVYFFLKLNKTRGNWNEIGRTFLFRFNEER